MKNFKPRKSVKRVICETLISALVLTVILGIIYYQERLWVLAMVLIFILDVLFCMFEEIKEYRIDDDGTVHVVCYLGFSKVVLKGITKVYFDPQRKALRIIAEKSDRWYPLQEPELFVDTLYEYYPDMEYENWS